MVDKPILGNLSETGEGAAHDFIMGVYRSLLDFFEATGAPEPGEFTITTGANIVGAAICDHIPPERDEEALAKVGEMIALTVRNTRMHRAATHKGGSA